MQKGDIIEFDYGEKGVISTTMDQDSNMIVAHTEQYWASQNFVDKDGVVYTGKKNPDGKPVYLWKTNPSAMIFTEEEGYVRMRR